MVMRWNRGCTGAVCACAAHVNPVHTVGVDDCLGHARRCWAVRRSDEGADAGAVARGLCGRGGVRQWVQVAPNLAGFVATSGLVLPSMRSGETTVGHGG
uniref:Uncharacterized protein n=1 Tax=Oryza rufipogon TaxID=4529 RepID=A0A0E0PPN1_ORYRU